MSVSGAGKTLSCADCHTSEPHKGSAGSTYNRHATRVACQSCHIPTFARTLPTKVWWDWSKAGQAIKAPKDEHGLKTYHKNKGEFRWAKDVVPVYRWFDGTVDRYLAGDTIDPKKVTHLNYPLGKNTDENVRLTPFKIMRGIQPYDAGNKVLAVPHLLGGYWKHYDWGKSISQGMTAAGLEYSGKFGFAETDMHWKVNHMVVPKARALECSDCHGDNGRIDWSAIGYDRDPMAAQM